MERYAQNRSKNPIFWTNYINKQFIWVKHWVLKCASFVMLLVYWSYGLCQASIHNTLHFLQKYTEKWFGFSHFDRSTNFIWWLSVICQQMLKISITINTHNVRFESKIYIFSSCLIRTHQIWTIKTALCMCGVCEQA